MFEDLVKFEPEVEPDMGAFVPVARADVQTLLDAQETTAQWLEDLGVPDDVNVEEEAEKATAREAFSALTRSTDPAVQRQALLTMKLPKAVRHLTGMLAAYDWEFVDQAKQLRGYAVAKILEETKNPNANVRLKALQMLGNVTEVALFTARVEVTQKDVSEEELEKRLRERLSRFLKPEPVQEVVDVPVIESAARPDA